MKEYEDITDCVMDDWKEMDEEAEEIREKSSKDVIKINGRNYPFEIYTTARGGFLWYHGKTVVDGCILHCMNFTLQELKKSMQKAIVGVLYKQEY